MGVLKGKRAADSVPAARIIVADRSATLAQWPDAPAYEAKYVIVDQAGRRALRVVLLGHRPSFLANMLPPGGWHFIGDASSAAGAEMVDATGIEPVTPSV